MNSFVRINFVTLSVLIVGASCMFAQVGKTTTTHRNNTAKTPKQVVATHSDEQVITNLRAFTKLYGYVRYFYPSDEAITIDWNKFAIYGSGKVKNARTTDELAFTLEELFLPIAPTLQILRPNEKPRPVNIPEHLGALLPVFWQHKGLGFGVYNLYGDDSPYRSFRLNRKITTNISQPSSGGVRQSIRKTFASFSNPILLLRGKDIKLTAAVRADVHQLEGGGKLWLRVDTDNGVGFFDNMGPNAIQSSEWNTYTIVGPVDSSAIDITFGCMLFGKGKLWVDDIRLYTRTNANRSWELFPIPNADFENYTITGSGRQAYLDWESRVKEYPVTPCRDNPNQGEYCAFIQYLPSENRDTDKELFAAKPKGDETIIKDLAGGLRCVLPIALYTTHTNTLGSTPKSMADFEKLLKVLSKDIQGKAEQLEQEPTRLANVVIAWNVLQHFYPYFDEVRTNWDSVLTVTLAATLKNPASYYFVKVMQIMMTALRDGYAEYNYMPKGFVLDVKVENIEGKPVIIASRDSLLKRGDVIVKVDGYEANARLVEEEALISGTSQWKRTVAADKIIHSATKEIPLTINRNGTLIDFTAKCKPLNSRKIFQHPVLEQISGDSLNDKIWYIDLAQVSIPLIEAKAVELSQAKGIIIDLRGQPQDGNGQILGYLADSMLLSLRYQVPQILYPDYKNVQGYNSNGRGHIEPRMPRWRGKTVFLSGGGTISQGEDIIATVDHYKLGEIVGETTAGASGSVNTQTLGGGASIRWTGMKVLKHDGSQLHNIGIKPTHPIKPTLLGIREGRDEALEEAIRIIDMSISTK